jgi:hypothetical protein
VIYALDAIQGASAIINATQFPHVLDTHLNQEKSSFHNLSNENLNTNTNTQ